MCYNNAFNNNKIMKETVNVVVELINHTKNQSINQSVNSARVDNTYTYNIKTIHQKSLLSYYKKAMVLYTQFGICSF
jgi:hypothetical protein